MCKKTKNLRGDRILQGHWASDHVAFRELPLRDKTLHKTKERKNYAPHGKGSSSNTHEHEKNSIEVLERRISSSEGNREIQLYSSVE
jgi:hypothetical protein